MGLRINANIAAMNALRNLDNTQFELGASIGRLSTGLRINTASDDPAGLIISEEMRAQLRGIEQAVRNSQDAVNMSKTAESAIDEVQRLLRNIRALAVHSANTAVVDSATLQANQTQIRTTLQSINRIAEQTQFGLKKLLDGSAGILANVTSVDYVTSLYMGSTFAGQSVQSGPVTISQVTAATRAEVLLGATFTSANDIVSTSGSFVINGHAFSSSGSESLQTIVGKINAMSQTTGVTAEIVGSGPVQVRLVQNTYGAQHSITYFDPSNILHTAGSATSTGVNAVYNVSVTTSAGVTTVPFTGGRGSQESGLKLTDNYGNTILLNEAGNANITGTPTEIGQITAGKVRFQIGGNAEQAVQFAMPVLWANRLGTGVIGSKTLADLDVTTQQGAQEAMRIIDEAIKQVALVRGELGAFQKDFLESNVRSLGVAQENLTASESQIRDVDMAAEMTQYTRLQILEQSGVAVLAQANLMPQSVLRLLQG